MTQTAEEVYNKLPTFQDYLDNMLNADAIEDLVNVFDSMLVEISHNYTDATTEELILNFKDWITFPQANLCFTFFNEAVLNLYNKTRDEEGKEGNMCLVNLRKADNLDTITKYIAKKEGLDNFYIKMVYREKELYRRYLLDILSDTPRNNIEKLDEKLVAEEFLAERGYCKFIYEYDEDFRKTGGKGDAGKANFLHTKFSWATTLIGIVGMAIVVGLIYLLWPVIDFCKCNCNWIIKIYRNTISIINYDNIKYETHNYPYRCNGTAVRQCVSTNQEERQGVYLHWQVRKKLSPQPQV